MDLDRYLADKQALVNQALAALPPPDPGAPERLQQAMRYSLQAGGKRLRPILALASCEAVGGDADQAWPFALALECIHTYSLIHDDLPAMDDDDLRRGKPTCHRQFDEATAILAGDGLLTLAFQLLADAPLPPALTVALIAQLARDAGQTGMVGGQMLDLLAEKRAIPLPELEDLHLRKTGALIRTACTGGARVGGGSPEGIQRLDRYGRAVGLAFQIADDLLDEEGESAKLGKNTGSDRRKAKSTYPGLLGIEGARKAALDLAEDAVATLSPLGPAADPLRALARFAVQRSH